MLDFAGLTPFPASPNNSPRVAVIAALGFSLPNTNHCNRCAVSTAHLLPLLYLFGRAVASGALAGAPALYDISPVG